MGASAGSRAPSARIFRRNRDAQEPYEFTAPHEIRGRSIAPGLLRLGLAGFLPGDVVDEFPRLYIESSSDVQKSEHAGAALPMLDIDESAETQPATLCELFQGVSPVFSEASNLHAEGQESGIW